MSIILLIVVSCMISIASKGMLVENQDQQRFRKLRTGYATSILLIVIITEVLWFLWIEDILQTYLLVVFIPMYIWALFYIVKMILLITSGFRSPLILLNLIDLVLFGSFFVTLAITYDFSKLIPDCIPPIVFLCYMIVKLIREILFAILANHSQESSPDSKVANVCRTIYMITFLLALTISDILYMTIEPYQLSKGTILFLPLMIFFVIAFFVVLSATLIAEHSSLSDVPPAKLIKLSTEEWSSRE
ncbi:hypothetical protein WA171_007347 [Blastocystis sp. BT1]